MIQNIFFRILEDMRETPTTAGDEDDDVDVGAFLEMLGAYLPGAEAIPEADIELWLRTVAKRWVGQWGSDGVTQVFTCGEAVRSMDL